MKKETVALGAFLVISAVDLIGILLGIDAVHVGAKPLLMVFLLGYYLVSTSESTVGRVWVVLALVFSWLGDVLLMSEDFFLAGLGSFLVAHLCFIKAYWLHGAKAGEVKPVDVVKFAVVGIGLMVVLEPYLGEMFIPVLVYASVLLGMAVIAHKRRGATSAISFTLVAAGAVFFVISDGIIAVNRFAFQIPFQQILVMSTYILAQFLIVQGLLKHRTV